MSLTCKECNASNHEAAINGRCPDCHRTATEKWQAKMAIRQDPTQFDLSKLVRLLLTQHWMHECQIVPDFIPPFPSEDTLPRCQVRYVYEIGETTFLL